MRALPVHAGRSGLILLLAFFLSPVALAGDTAPATAAEAKAMLNRAIAELKVNEVVALEKFNDANNAQFRDRELYVFCSNASDGIITAHPNPAVKGADIRKVMAGDDPFGQKMFDAAKEGLISTVSYNYAKPGSTTPTLKESFFTRVGSQVCGVGYWK